MKSTPSSQTPMVPVLSDVNATSSIQPDKKANPPIFSPLQKIAAITSYFDQPEVEARDKFWIKNVPATHADSLQRTLPHTKGNGGFYRQDIDPNILRSQLKAALQAKTN